MRGKLVQSFVLTGVVGVCLGLTTPSQAFFNLDFEQASVVKNPIAGMGTTAATSAAMPGWTISYSNPYLATPATMDVGQYVMDYTEVALMGPGTRTGAYSYDIPQIQGQFMAYLESFNFPNIPSESKTVSISQVGTIPVGTKSIRFQLGQPENGAEGHYPAFSAVQLLINNTPISTVALSGANNIWSLGADISAYAGTSVNLSFQSSSANVTTFMYTRAYLDDIQFSTTSVPEPASLGLLGLGAVGLLRRRVWVK